MEFKIYFSKSGCVDIEAENITQAKLKLYEMSDKDLLNNSYSDIQIDDWDIVENPKREN